MPRRAPQSRRSYNSYVTFVDGAIGELIEALQKKRMWENTLMVVSSDNGGPQYLSENGYARPRHGSTPLVVHLRKPAMRIRLDARPHRAV